MLFSWTALAAAALLSSAAAKPAPPIPTQTLPLKTHVFADTKCSQSRANLYYIPDGFCIGPLYHPASSIRVANYVPSYCNLTAYSDGHCQGDRVVLSAASGHRQKVLAGPTDLGSCFGVGGDPAEADGNISDIPGANSFFLECES